jgi:hypothetical protein
VLGGQAAGPPNEAALACWIGAERSAWIDLMGRIRLTPARVEGA